MAGFRQLAAEGCPLRPGVVHQPLQAGACLQPRAVACPPLQVGAYPPRRAVACRQPQAVVCPPRQVGAFQRHQVAGSLRHLAEGCLLRVRTFT